LVHGGLVFLIWLHLLHTWHCTDGCRVGTADHFDGPAGGRSPRFLSNRNNSWLPNPLSAGQDHAGHYRGPRRGIRDQSAWACLRFFIDAVSFLFIIVRFCFGFPTRHHRWTRRNQCFSLFGSLPYVAKDVPLRSLMLGLWHKFFPPGRFSAGTAYLAKTRFGIPPCLA